MTESEHDSDAIEPPLQYARRAVTRAWRDLLSVYYANAPIWRLIKSLALLFFGFFCWSGANLLLSYRPEWTVLQYVMAYGFVLLLWGPLTHAVVVPLVIRLRRSAEHPVARWVARNGSKANLSVFLLIVLVLGTAPIAPMTLDFQSSLQGAGESDVDPDLLCSRADGVVHCHLSESEGIDHVVVTTGDRELERVEDPPFEFDVRQDELEEVLGQKEFVVELRDEDGDTIRRYRRTVSMIPAGSVTADSAAAVESIDDDSAAASAAIGPTPTEPLTTDFTRSLAPLSDRVRGVPPTVDSSFAPNRGSSPGSGGSPVP